MTYQQIVSLLGYAGDHDRSVRIITSDRHEVIGIPTSVDTDLAAHEVYLRSPGDNSIEIALSLGEIQAVELV